MVDLIDTTHYAKRLAVTIALAVVNAEGDLDVALELIQERVQINNEWDEMNKTLLEQVLREAKEKREI